MSRIIEHDDMEYTYEFLDLTQEHDRWICRWEVINPNGVKCWIHEERGEDLLPVAIADVDELICQI